MKTSAQTVVFTLLNGISALVLVQASEIPTRGPMPFELFDASIEDIGARF